MEAVVGIFIGLAILAGLYFLVFKKKKQPEQKEVKGFKEYNLKVANLTAKGMEENRDFVVAIISQSELQSKTPEQVEKWVGGKLGKEGILGNYDADLGLQEITFMSEGKTYDVFFLIVEETLQNVIDWKEPKPVEPEPSNPYIINLVDDGEDYTRVIRQQIAEVPDGIGTVETIEFRGRAKTHGMLPEDMEVDNGPVGGGKILRLHNRKNLHLTGGKFYNPEPAFEVSPPGRVKSSENVFLDIKGCQDISITDLEFTGPHNTLRDSTGFPTFKGLYEFEHCIDIGSSQNVYIRGLKANNIYGDGVYFRSDHPANSHITIKDCDVYFNGRQGFGWGDGTNTLIEDCNVWLGGRGGADFEPSRETTTARNIIVRNSHFKTHLLPFPMGGLGYVENLLIENNTTESARATTTIKGDRVNSFRRNIILRNNKHIMGFGSDSYAYNLIGCENILIEGEERAIADDRGNNIAHFSNCRNIIFRNNNIINGGFITLSDTPVEEVKIYGNVQDIKFKIVTYDMPWIDPPYIFSPEFLNDRGSYFVLWRDARHKWEAYMEERAATAKEEIVEIVPYDVEKYGEPEIPKEPDFEPYWGVDRVRPPEPVRNIIEIELHPDQAIPIFTDRDKIKEYFNGIFELQGIPEDGEMNIDLLLQYFSNEYTKGKFSAKYTYYVNGQKHITQFIITITRVRNYPWPI